MSGPSDSGGTPGPGWWMDDDGVLRPPSGAQAPTGEPTPVAEPPTEQLPNEPTPTTATPTTATPTTAAPTTPPPPTPEPPSVSAPDLPPTARGEAFGTTFTWACRAVRQHAGRLLLLGLAVLVLYVATAIVVLVISVVGTQIEVALVRAVLSFLAVAVGLAAAAWSWLLLSRSWFRIARGDEVQLDLASPVGVGPVAVVLVLTSPIWLFTGPIAFGFVVVALALAHEPLSGTAAVGRMLAETFSSARRFFHTLLVGLGVGAALVTLFLVVSWTSLVVTSAVASTTVQNWWEDGDDLFRDLDTTLTSVMGIGINALIALVVGYAIVSVGGLWAAGHLRVLTGRRPGQPGAVDTTI